MCVSNPTITILFSGVSMLAQIPSYVFQQNLACVRELASQDWYYAGCMIFAFACGLASGLGIAYIVWKHGVYLRGNNEGISGVDSQKAG